MIVITTHVNADFDCLASMAAALKLYPGALLIFPGSQEKNVRNFLEKTGYSLPIRRLKNIDTKKITKLVIVDCRSRERIGSMNEVCDRPGVTLVVYDHHPDSSGDLKSRLGRIEQRGSTTTLMMEILQEKGIDIRPEEATLFMLGIYEDTGSLTFSSTCTADFQAAAWLLERGANLNIVSDFLHRNLNAEQIALLHELVNRLEIHMINGVEVALAVGSSGRYVGDLAMVAHALKDMENLSALFVIVEMEGRLSLVARSRIAAVDAGLVASRFGGGGHQTAASATIRNMLLDEAQEALIKELKKTIPPAPTAEKMMITPVISADKNDKLETVEELLTRHQISAMPVMDGGEVAGLITLQIVKKALYHKLAKEKTADYMLTEFTSVKSDASSETIKEITINQRQKIVPVVDAYNRLLGIISRVDVMRAMYSGILKSPASMLQPERKIRRPVSRNVESLLKETLSAEIITLLDRVAECASECGYSSYAVGGFVRDLLMRRKNFDLDVVIEGDGIEFANRFTAKYGGKVKAHKKFKTAVMVLGHHRKIDVATARTEYYSEPAALPVVEMSSIKNDLYRRDFTVNALAIKLNGTDKNHLIDFFGGQQDLKDSILRVLHNLSFVEDPTRVLRAVRFEQRFSFHIGSQTEKLLKLAAEKDLLGRVSGARLFGELKLIFKEERPTKAMKRMEELKLWRFIHPKLRYNATAHRLCTHAEEAIAWHHLTFDSEKLREWFVYVLCLSTFLNARQTMELARKLGFSEKPAHRLTEERRQVVEKSATLGNLTLKSPVEIYETLNDRPAESLLAIMAASAGRKEKRIVAEYMGILRYVTTKVNGNDLISAGLERGPLMGRVMRALQRENLKKALPTKEDEIRFAKNFYRVLKENRGLKTDAENAELELSEKQ
ncbi:MAG: CBS domain-containing protein [Nitrospinota bacterium]